jgi:hypothetical protein
MHQDLKWQDQELPAHQSRLRERLLQTGNEVGSNSPPSKDGLARSRPADRKRSCAQDALRRPANLGRWADRCFASARFRCSGTRYNGVPCRGIGMPVIRPSELLPVGGPVALAFLWCNSCIWEIDQAHLDKSPWSGSRQRYCCPGCSGAVRWHIHGLAWRPFESRDSPWWL